MKPFRVPFRCAGEKINNKIARNVQKYKSLKSVKKSYKVIKYFLSPYFSFVKRPAPRLRRGVFVDVRTTGAKTCAKFSSFFFQCVSAKPGAKSLKIKFFIVQTPTNPQKPVKKFLLLSQIVLSLENKQKIVLNCFLMRKINSNKR